MCLCNAMKRAETQRVKYKKRTKQGAKKCFPPYRQSLQNSFPQMIDWLICIHAVREGRGMGGYVSSCRRLGDGKERTEDICCLSDPFAAFIGTVSRNCTGSGWSRPFPPYHVACSVEDEIPEVSGGLYFFLLPFS